MEKFRLYGLIGFPVSHSYSPSMHNAAFKKLKINAAYFLFPIPPDKFRQGFGDLLGLGVRGLNVTIPHKETVIRYMDSLSRSARLTGAVNTVIVKGGRLHGDNTDGRGFVKAFTLNTGKSPKGKRIFMFGAGGGAKAVGFEMAAAGASSLVICDVLKNKAGALASRVNRYTKCKSKAISARNKKRIAGELANADVLINATPRGMKKADPALIDRNLLHKKMVVCDLIYNPSETRLIKDARKMRIPAFNGIDMLLHQGALSFNLWTGRRPPVEVMRRALQSRMKKR